MYVCMYVLLMDDKSLPFSYSLCGSARVVVVQENGKDLSSMSNKYMYIHTKKIQNSLCGSARVVVVGSFTQ